VTDRSLPRRRAELRLTPRRAGEDAGFLLAEGDLEGVRWRRAGAYLFDLMLIAGLAAALWMAGAIAIVFTLGLAKPLVVLASALLPLAYHSLCLAGAGNATPGMRLFDLRMALRDGRRPDLAHTVLHTVVFYVSVGATSGLVLLWTLVDGRKRCLHDVLCGTMIVRR